MIKSFKHKGLQKFFEDGIRKGIQPKHADRIADILDLLDAADTIQVMNFPGSDLHLLHPKKDNIWAVSVSGNWRIVFKYENGDAYNVDYADYH
ncbi:MAG: type II toxin-antitoxin system RelE/ParE family toxin [Pseudomonadota bacterium]